jgi:hypothetical protein
MHLHISLCIQFFSVSNLYMYVTIYLCIYICWSISLPICLFNCASNVYLSINHIFYMHLYTSLCSQSILYLIYMHIYIYIYLSLKILSFFSKTLTFYQNIYPSIYLFHDLSVYLIPSIYLFIYLHIYLLNYLPIFITPFSSLSFCYLTMLSVLILNIVGDRMINEYWAVGGTRIGRGNRKY